MKYTIHLFTILILLVLSCSKNPSSTEQPPKLVKREMVLFASDRNGGNMNIWMMEKDGSNPRQVTFYTEGDYFPADISPDGKTLLFYRWDHRTLYTAIYTMPTVGPQPAESDYLITQLCFPGNFFPDGQRFVYAQHTIISDTMSHDAVYIFDHRDSSSILVTSLGLTLKDAAWNPVVSSDGNKVCYVKFYFDPQFGRSGSFLAMTDLTTSQIDTITPGTWGRFVDKAVFKNQNEMIITSNLLSPGTQQIIILSLNTGDMTSLTDFVRPHFAYSPAIDEVGASIYFRYNAGAVPDTTSEIAMIDINGDNFKVLTNNNNREASPVVAVLEFYE